jgi:uncharacterized protein (TIGR02246 family)
MEHLYNALLTAWNNHDAKGIASLFCDDGTLVGFDGSQISGAANIFVEMEMIFKHHRTAPFVWIVREVRHLDPNTVLLRAHAGMLRDGDINPELNAVQVLVAVKQEAWRIAHFQNTPARFHGRLEFAEKFTAELRALL